MSWLLPSLPAIPGWSRQTPASSSSIKRTNGNHESQNVHIEEDAEEEDLDVPPQFPLPDSAQRSQPPAKEPSPAFNLQPPSPPRSSDIDPPSDLNIAIIPDAIPIGNMAPPPSTTKKPDFGLQNGGGLGKKEEVVKEKAQASSVKAKEKKGKVALGPGCSALDWARLTQSGKDLRGTSTFPVRVTLDELKKHNTREDAWSVFNGRVYNITPYLPFHPGGVDELMRVAGRDGTKLFMLTHSWVNLEYMMQECMVGMLVRG